MDVAVAQTAQIGRALHECVWLMDRMREPDGQLSVLIIGGLNLGSPGVSRAISSTHDDFLVCGLWKSLSAAVHLTQRYQQSPHKRLKTNTDIARAVPATGEIEAQKVSEMASAMCGCLASPPVMYYNCSPMRTYSTPRFRFEARKVSVPARQLLSQQRSAP